MKKLLCIILALTAFFTLVSCKTIDKTADSTPLIDTDTKAEVESKPETENEPQIESEAEHKETLDTSDATEIKPLLSSLTIKGSDISEYKIVYSSNSKNGAKEQAERLAEHIKSVFWENRRYSCRSPL